MKKASILMNFIIWFYCSSNAQNPIISNFFPASATICGGDNGDVITITGVFFQIQGGNSDVSIGGKSCTIISWNSSQIICTAESEFGPFSGFVIVTNQSRNSSIGSIFKTVNPTPNNLISFTASLFNITNCGDSTMLISGGTNGNTIFYEGFCGGIAIGTGVVKKVAPISTTNYFAANKSFVGGCISECRQATITVNVSCIAPTITSFPATACTGNTITLNGSGFLGATSISFNGVDAPSFSINSATSLTVTVPSNAASGLITITSPGGTATSSGNITITPGLVLVISPESPAICEGSAVTLSALGATTYSWSPSTSLSSDTGPNVSANPVNTTTYQVTGNTGSCSGTTSVTVVVSDPPTIAISPASPVELCSEPVALEATAGLIDYRWSNLATTSTIAVNQPGEYFVQAKNQTGCIGYSDTVEVISVQLPIADFAYSQPNPSYLIQFSNQSQHADSFLWDFGQGNFSSEQSPEYPFPNSGIFPVSLIATNSCGSDTVVLNVDIITIGINQPLMNQVSIAPNPFHDNIRILLQMNALENLNVSIYNMLGQLVYHEGVIGQKEQTIYLDLTQLTPGVYSVQLNNTFGNLSRRVVKN